MEINPYTPASETDPKQRSLNLPSLILVSSLTAAIALVCSDAPRWAIVVAGGCAALAADELLSQRLVERSDERTRQ